MKSLKFVVSYILVAFIGLWMAFALSFKFIKAAQSQEATEDSAMPAEYSKELEASLQKNDSVDGKQEANSEANNEVNSSDAKNKSKEFTPSNKVLINSENYIYDPTGKRDPFKPFRGAAGKINVKLEPLQEFDLDQMQVVGIVWGVQKSRALIRTPKGDIYPVYPNSRIGRNEGVVGAIREGEIVVFETLYDEGKTYRKTRIMEIKRVR